MERLALWYQTPQPPGIPGVVFPRETQSVLDVPESPDGSMRVAIADLDGNGRAEIVVGPSRGRIMTFQRRTDGTFASSRSVAAPPEPMLSGFLATDLTADGLADVAFVTARGLRYLTMHDGSLALRAGGPRNAQLALERTRPVEGTGAAGIVRLLSSDVDRDGRPEVVTLARIAGGAPAITALSAVPDVPPQALLPASDVMDLAAADFNRDGFGDVAVVRGSEDGPRPRTAEVRYGPDHGSAVALSLPWKDANEIAAGEIDGDGWPDLLVVDGLDDWGDDVCREYGPTDNPGLNIETCPFPRVVPFLGGPGGGFRMAAGGLPFRSSYLYYAPQLIDLNGDGRDESVFEATDSSTVMYMNRWTVVPFPPDPPKPPDPSPPDDRPTPGPSTGGGGASGGASGQGAKAGEASRPRSGGRSRPKLAVLRVPKIASAHGPITLRMACTAACTVSVARTLVIIRPGGSTRFQPLPLRQIRIPVNKLAIERYSLSQSRRSLVLRMRKAAGRVQLRIRVSIVGAAPAVAKRFTVTLR
jgi:hypothetical protein